MMTAKPDAFLSYTRFDDRRGKISDFQAWLSDAVEEVSGRPFEIFQDVEGIGLGQKWKDVLDEMLDQARFFIPILTPKFFSSRPCREELIKFLEMERRAGRQDLVMPVYWITCPVLEEKHLKAKDELAQAIDERQRWDWRDLRFKASEEEVVQRDIAGLASQIERARRNVLRLIETPKEAIAIRATKRPAPKFKTVARQPAPPKKAPPNPPNLSAGFRDIDAPWCPKMVVIPTGTLMMGSPENEAKRANNEGPQHQVHIVEPFALGLFTVTFEEFDYFCAEIGHRKPDDRGWGRGRRPVIDVLWKDALAYCNWLSQVTGRNYHLPSEAQWEYACRAGTTTPFSTGATITTGQANYNGNEPYGREQKGDYRRKTTEVGSFLANSFGLYDMHGNVSEWCADQWHDDYDRAPNTGVPWLANDDTRRVLRGGAWYSDAQNLRSARREASPPDHRSSGIGFRCARAPVSPHELSAVFEA